MPVLMCLLFCPWLADVTTDCVLHSCGASHVVLGTFVCMNSLASLETLPMIAHIKHNQLAQETLRASAPAWAELAIHPRDSFSQLPGTVFPNTLTDNTLTQGNLGCGSVLNTGTRNTVVLEPFVPNGQHLSRDIIPGVWPQFWV